MGGPIVRTAVARTCERLLILTKARGEGEASLMANADVPVFAGGDRNWVLCSAKAYGSSFHVDG